MARVAYAGFLHEVNSFSDVRADYGYFDGNPARPPMYRGEELKASLEHSAFCPAGFIKAWHHDDQLLPLLWANGGAGGTVTRDAFERIVGEMMARLSAVLPVDGLYLDLHGAMVSEDFDDAEGEILRRSRAIVGLEVPIVISLDYHANVSPNMARYADAIVIYKTYPHVDRPETGERAARALKELLASGPAQGRAIRHASFLVPVDFQCTYVDPSRTLVQWQPPRAEGVITASYAAGFPPSDTVWCGPSVVVHARDQAIADEVADAYIDYFNSLESQFCGTLWPAAQAATHAKRLALTSDKPIILADTCDNPGAGGTGKTTGMIHELLAAGASDALVGYLCDPATAHAAMQAGEGKIVHLALDGPDGESRDYDFRVIRCSDEPYEMSGPMVPGLKVDFGPMALLQCEGVQVAVLSQRFQAYDRTPFLKLGVDFSKIKILVLKSSCHFRADFGSMADTILTVVSPGAYDPNPEHYRYTKLRPNVRFHPGGGIPAGLHSTPATSPNS
jgi:microcystin degradation protein MlrC